MAAAVKSILVFAACFLATAWGLQVAPNSPCSSICTDGGSDPNQSNFVGSDIVCKDSDYPGSAAGQRFSSCINCLQNSTFSASGQSDQAWFLYNLRFALNTCIYGEANATDPISTPCSTDLDCGPMQGALQDGMSDPSTAQEYSYCSAYDNSFVGSALSRCSQCLSTGAGDLFYMSNFLVALDAGCIQQPPVGVLIGLNSTLFSSSQVAIISPVTAVSGSNSSKKLPTGAIIGIVVAGAVTLLVAIAITFVCAKKRSNSKRLKQLRSPLDARFGAGNISAPYEGNYGSPDSPPLLKENIPMKEGPKVINFSRQNTRRVSESTLFSFQESPSIPQYSPAPISYSQRSPPPAPYNQHAPPYNKFAPPVSSPQQSPLPSGRDAIPIHPAYIPGKNTTPPLHARSPTGPAMSPPLRPGMSPPLPRSGPSPHPQRSPSNGPLSGTSTRSGPSTASTVSPISVNRAPSRGPGQGRDVIREVTIARDISAGRGNESAPGAISGPIISVGNRFDRFESDEEARKAREEEARKAREKLYKEGVGGLKIPFSKTWKGRPDNSPDKTSPANSEGALW